MVGIQRLLDEPRGCRRWRVRWKLMLLVALLLGAISTFTCLFFPARLQRLIIRSTDADARHLGTMAAFSVEPALVFGDRESGIEALRGSVGSSRIAYLVVRDAADAVFASVNLEAAVRAGYRDPLDLARPGDAAVHRTITPIHRGDRRIGTLYLGVSLTEMRAEIEAMRATIALVSALVFAVGVAATFGISTFVIRPLGRMRAAAEAIALGDWTRRAPVTTGDEVGELARVFNFMVDRFDTTRQDLERLNRDLQRSNEEFTLAASAVDGVIYDLDVASGELRLTDSLARVFGYAPEERLTTLSWWRERIHPQDRPRVAARAEAARAGDQDFVVEYRFRAHDGRFLHVRDRGLLVRGADGRAARMVGLLEDVTDVKRLEDQVLQSQKLDAIGQLAGGVAHDFNNLLTTILGYSDLLLAALPADSAHRGPVAEIRKSGQRAAGLTSQLLAFSRKQVVEPRLLEFNAVVADLGKMLRRLIGEDVVLVTRLDPKAGRVRADATQLEQVILNVAVNARDAMQAGGRLEIATSRRAVGSDDAEDLPGLAPGVYASLSIRDSGCGMDEETRSRIFEPFFTTKGPGRGTGLGMAMVYGIVKRSDGHIRVDSELGTGTTVTVFFPQVDARSESEAAAERDAPAPGANETILLVEDEESVRKLAGGVLAAGGYRVLEADLPSRALELAARHGRRIDLLLTDVVMPEMSGRELAERLVARWPETPVLYMSGYLDDTILRHGVDGGGQSLLQKPFTPAVLLGRVRDALDARLVAAAPLAVC